METNNNKKSFSIAEVVRRAGFCPDNITAIKAAGVTEVTINAQGRIVITWGTKLVMWDAPATPAGKIAAQKAILAAGLKLTGVGVLPAALPKQPAAAPKAAPVAKPAPKAAAPANDEAEWDAARDAKDAEKTDELLALLDQLAEEAKVNAPEEKKEAKPKEAKVKRTPRTRAPKAK